ncbi:MAG: pyruvate, phosphate dikinase [bacterium]|nr:pyruvate, phosphate dikinase [bacterium]
MIAEKYVYFFGDGKAEGNVSMKDLLGGKGSGLAEMTNIGIPVPPGFTITTKACIYYSDNNKAYPFGLEEEILEHLQKLEDAVGKKFGRGDNPLLVSVRSGAKFSMPGMMDTVLNLGLNDKTVVAFAKKINNERTAYDSYRRFITMFSSVVLGMEHKDFEFILDEEKEEQGVELDTKLGAESLKDLVYRYKEAVKSLRGIEFPQDPMTQLKMAINAVFESWDNPRAVTYRKLHDIPHDMGTAVNIQAMVFGNMGDNSGTGVAFTRNPSTGEKIFYGEYLLNAQGEDVVAGIRTPHPIADLQSQMPQVYEQLTKINKILEQKYRDMQDIEFTIEDGKLFLLQTRNGKRTAQAALKIVVDMVSEGMITKDEALLRLDPNQLNHLLHPILDPSAKYEISAKGLPASPGAACGKAVFNADEAVEMNEIGDNVILVRQETCPDDIHGMHAAKGILTARGGMTSHAAVVARGMGKCCVAGCSDIKVNEEAKYFTVGETKINQGDYITIDGSIGHLILGKVDMIKPSLSSDFGTIMAWADDVRKLKIRANADYPHDAKVARDFGAEGIGLCRTEHMFFEKTRIPIMQKMILATKEEERRQYLNELLPMQREDFTGLFKVMDGCPVTIRLLDPPLHEFLPRREELMVEIANLKCKNPNDPELAEKETLLKRIEELHEFNPMLGHRGCRLGITYPEITEMQARAIFEAACEATNEGYKILPEVMIPLIGDVKEFNHQKKIVNKVAKEVMEKNNLTIDYMVGTMIELPRAALTADKIAQEAEFFSYGTNDLTQTTFGFSRDDAGNFIRYYLDNNIFEKDPFQVLDTEGVGELIKIGVEKGRSTCPDLKIGICGEHGGEPSSIAFCNSIGLNYVSCSPYRVPIARLSAAIAHLKSKKC